MKFTNHLSRHKHAFALDPLALDFFIWYFDIRHHLLFHDVEKQELHSFALQWPEFKYRLFWRAVEVRRAKRDGDVWLFRICLDIDNSWMPSEEYIEPLFHDLNNKTQVEDRLIALEAIFEVYCNGSRDKNLENHAIEAIKDEKPLASRWKKLVRARFESSDKKPAQISKWERDRALRDELRRKAREEWIAVIKSVANKLMDVGDPVKGIVWERTAYLYREMAELSKSSSSCLGISNWQDLITEFGIEAARNFREGCIRFWRKHDPFKKLDYREDRSIPWATTIGLSGIAMETAENPDWFKGINSFEAIQAAKYGILELNGFPGWFSDLIKQFPDEVFSVISPEIEWEFKQDFGGKYYRNIVSRFFYAGTIIPEPYMRLLLKMIEEIDPPEEQILHYSMSLILSAEFSSSNKANLSKICSRRVETTTYPNRKHLWLYALFCIDGNAGLQQLKQILKDTKSQAEKKQVIIDACAIFIDHYGLRFKPRRCDFLRIEVLNDLLPLIYRFVPVEEDIHHTGTYSPGKRDHAGETRSLLLNAVTETPGRQSYLLLIKLSQNSRNTFLRNRLRALAKERAARDAEPHPWKVKDIKDFIDSGIKAPSSEFELFRFAIDLLEEIKVEIEEGDYSIADMLQSATKEIILRNYFAGDLKRRGQSFIDVSPEDELADSSKIDVRIKTPTIQNAVPIEIKIAEKWTLTEMKISIENQLIKKYMRQSDYGIFLVLRQARAIITPKSRKLPFEKLIVELQEHADGLIEKDLKLLALRVVGIDFGKRNVRS